MTEASEAAGATDRIAELEAENRRLRSALAAAGLDIREARTGTAAAETATRLSRADAAAAAAGHARDMALGRAELADAAALNARLQDLNAELRASEERLDAVVESATDHAIIEMDFSGRITGWSPGAETMLGWTAAEAIGLDGAMIWTAEDRTAGLPGSERQAADVTGSAADERWHVRRDGTRFWGSGHLTPLRNGRPRGYLKVLRDRTAERRAEEALRESEARHRLLIESWAQAVWETDAEGVVTADSPSWRAYTGQTLEEWLGDGWLDAIHPDDRAYAERQWRDAVAVRGLVDAEYRLRAPDGGWRWTNVRAAPVPDAAGRVGKWVGMNIDIDMRKRVEEALRDSEERYRALFSSMDEAYAVVEVLRGEGGAWCDFRFVEVNPAFTVHTAMPHPVGKTVTELLGTPNPRWAQLYGQALDTGEGDTGRGSRAGPRPDLRPQHLQPRP